MVLCVFPKTPLADVFNTILVMRPRSFDRWNPESRRELKMSFDSAAGSDNSFEKTFLL